MAEKDKSGYYLLAIVAVVAVAAMITISYNSNRIQKGSPSVPFGEVVLEPEPNLAGKATCLAEDSLCGKLISSHACCSGYCQLTNQMGKWGRYGYCTSGS